jgi:hypothetical protein
MSIPVLGNIGSTSAPGKTTNDTWSAWIVFVNDSQDIYMYIELHNANFDRNGLYCLRCARYIPYCTLVQVNICVPVLCDSSLRLVWLWAFAMLKWLFLCRYVYRQGQAMSIGRLSVMFCQSNNNNGHWALYMFKCKIAACHCICNLSFYGTLSVVHGVHYVYLVDITIF